MSTQCFSPLNSRRRPFDKLLPGGIQWQRLLPGSACRPIALLGCSRDKAVRPDNSEKHATELVEAKRGLLPLRVGMRSSHSRSYAPTP